MTGCFITNCPINEQTADAVVVGRCWHALDNNVCPRHGDVSVEVEMYKQTGKLTLENNYRRRVGKPLLGVL